MRLGDDTGQTVSGLARLEARVANIERLASKQLEILSDLSPPNYAGQNYAFELFEQFALRAAELGSKAFTNSDSSGASASKQNTEDKPCA